MPLATLARTLPPRLKSHFDIPVNKPLVLAQSPDAKKVARVEPAGIKRLEEATKSRGDIIRLDCEKYYIGEKLGEGSFGLVFKGDKLSHDGPLPVAIKFVGDPS